MTLPFERTNSVNITRAFLVDLLNPKKTPKVPKVIRERAYRCLRHYPHSLDMEQACEMAPKIFKKSFYDEE